MGNAYIEHFVTPRLLRNPKVLRFGKEQGTANILALDVIRLFKKYDALQFFC